MFKDVVSVVPLEQHRLRVKFEDGIEGMIDVSALVTWTGVFAPLADAREFARASVNHELGCVSWPSGADLDPDVLYTLVTNRPIGVLQQNGE